MEALSYFRMPQDVEANELPDNSEQKFLQFRCFGRSVSLSKSDFVFLSAYHAVGIPTCISLAIPIIAIGAGGLAGGFAAGVAGFVAGSAAAFGAEYVYVKCQQNRHQNRHIVPKDSPVEVSRAFGHDSEAIDKQTTPLLNDRSQQTTPKFIHDSKPFKAEALKHRFLSQ